MAAASTLLHAGAMLCRYGGVQLGPARFMYIVDAARNLLDKGGHVKKPEALPPPPSEEEESVEGSSEDEVWFLGTTGSRVWCARVQRCQPREGGSRGQQAA